MHGAPRWDPKRGNGGSLTASRWGGKCKWGKLGRTPAVGREGAPVKPVVCLAGYYALRNCTGGGRSFHLGANQLLKNPHPRAAEPPSSLLLTYLKNGDCTQTCSVLTSTCTGPTYAPNEIFFFFPALRGKLCPYAVLEVVASPCLLQNRGSQRCGWGDLDH